MESNYVHLKSLCRVTEDFEGRLWLTRLGDIFDGKIYGVTRSERETNYFENRNRIFRNNGPSEVGFIGVWDWTAKPNENNPESDYVESTYLPEVCPTGVFIVRDAQSQEDLIKKLKAGTISSRKTMICNTFFCYAKKANLYAGVICSPDQFEYVDKKVVLQEDICALPYYEVNEVDIYKSSDLHLRFLSRLELGEGEMYPLVDFNRLLTDIILKRITWPLYKECIGKTKAEWRDCKSIFERACSESLYEEVADKIGSSVDKVVERVDEYIERANELIDAGDIESELLSEIIWNNDRLKKYCGEIAEEKWKETHKSELREANQSIQALQEQVEKEKTWLKASQEDYNQVISNIETAQRKLEELKSKIDARKQLAEDTERSIREKMSKAQMDMAEFLADFSAFMPNRSQSPTEQKWEFRIGIEGRVNKILGGWEDTYELIENNLEQAGVISQLKRRILAAFLYAAFVQKFPILLLGPSSKEIADAVSLAITGSTTSILNCRGKRDMTEMMERPTDCIAVENPFNPEWINSLPELNSFPKPMFWLHPFMDDMIMEPQGLVNYAFPLLTEIFVETTPKLEMKAGVRGENYEAFKPCEEDEKMRLSFAKQLKVSRLTLLRLEAVLRDAKKIGNLGKNQAMEDLMVSIPLAIAFDKREKLSELREAAGIEKEVRRELEYYLEDE